MTASYAKTAQIISTDTPRWVLRLDAWALAIEASRADAIRQAIHSAIEAWERTNGVQWVDAPPAGQSELDFTQT